MKNEKILHRRLVANSKPLFDELLELGFEEDEPQGRGLNQIRVFHKGNKKITVSHEAIELLTVPKLGAPVMMYQGLTIHDEMLKFFAIRDPFKVKKDE